MRRIIDVTLTLDDSLPGFRKTTSRIMERDGWNASDLTIYSHAGTHVDAPVHFNVSPITVDRIPPERFFCKCHIIRLNGIHPGKLIMPSDIKISEERLKEGEGIILHTGWSKFIHEPDQYRDRLPRISEELAHWMVERKIGLVGVEPPSIADVNNLEEVHRVHRILLQNNVIIVEGLCNLNEVKNDDVELVVLPLKIGEGDGAPARAVIIEAE